MLYRAVLIFKPVFVFLACCLLTSLVCQLVSLSTLCLSVMHSGWLKETNTVSMTLFSAHLVESTACRKKTPQKTAFSAGRRGLHLCVLRCYRAVPGGVREHCAGGPPGGRDRSGMNSFLLYDFSRERNSFQVYLQVYYIVLPLAETLRLGRTLRAKRTHEPKKANLSPLFLLATRGKREIAADSRSSTLRRKPASRRPSHSRMDQ